jgi:hypothetical protein
MRHLVVCSTKFEAEDWRQVLSFEEDLAAHAGAHIGGMCKGSFGEGEDLVDFGTDDESDVLRQSLAGTSSILTLVSSALTSGVPFGSNSASGTSDCARERTFSGGEGLAEYSVRAEPLNLGVCGSET